MRVQHDASAPSSPSGRAARSRTPTSPSSRIDFDGFGIGGRRFVLRQRSHDRTNSTRLTTPRARQNCLHPLLPAIPRIRTRARILPRESGGDDIPRLYMATLGEPVPYCSRPAFTSSWDSSWTGTGLRLPDLVAVLADGAVRGELARARGVQDRHARPAFLVAIGLVDQRLAIRVRLVVGEHEVRIVVHEIVDQRLELAACCRARRSRRGSAAMMACNSSFCSTNSIGR